MFSAEAYSFRQQSRLAISLSWVAGFSDVIALLACRSFISHMTGNSARIGANGGERIWGLVAFYLAVAGSFLLGATVSAILMELAKRRGAASKYIAPLALEALLLGLFMLAIERQPATDAPSRIAFIGACAMGIQNATITRISGAVVRSTHVTGVITDFGIESVQWAFWAWDRLRGRIWQRAGRVLRVSQRHPRFLQILLLASIWGSFVFGAVAGSAAYLWVGAWALAAPILFLLLLIFRDWRLPIAAIREIDLLADPELKLHGIVHTLLPAELGVYRLTHDRRQGVRAPNFAHWLERVPAEKKVIILVLSPVMKFEMNAILDLGRAVSRLEAQHRRLIVAGLNTLQYKRLAHEHLVEQIGADRVCPDLEFAIAQGVELVRDLLRAPQPA